MPKWLFLIMMSVFSLSSYASWPAEIETNEVEVGGVLYHLRELTNGKPSNYGNYGIRHYLKPVFLVSHKGWVGGYFKNSHQRNSYVLGMRRYWSAKKLEKFNMLPGFAVGMVTGYCKGPNSSLDIYDDCSNNRKWHPVPYAQLFLKFKKDNLSLNVGYSFVLTYLTASYYFN